MLFSYRIIDTKTVKCSTQWKTNVDNNGNEVKAKNTDLFSEKVNASGLKYEIQINKSCFENAIFFFEDIHEVWTIEYIRSFFDWLGANGYLQLINGIIIGKMQFSASFEPYAEAIREIVTDKYNLPELPIMYGLNFGHTSPICVLPYGAEAELDIDNLKFSINENGVI